MNSSWPLEDLLAPGQWKTLETILLHLNWVALVCVTFQILMHLIFKHQFPRTMPLQLGIVTWILHASLLIGPVVGFVALASDAHRSLCYFQGIAIQFSTMATGCWLLNISIHLYLTCVQKWGQKALRKIIPLIHIFGWGFPVLVTLPPLLAHPIQFGPRGSWCWIIANANDHGAWEWGCFYAPMVLILVMTSVLWFRVVIHVCKVSTQFKTMTYVIQSVFIVFFLTVGYGIQFGHRVYNVLYGTTFWLEAVHTVSLSTIGIFVFLVYGLTYDNIQMMKRLCRCRKQYEELPTSPVLLND